MSDPTLFSKDPRAKDLSFDSDSVYNTMLAEGGMEFGFNIEVADPRLDRTISIDAMKMLRQQMISWVATRLQRKLQQTGRGAKKIQVTVTVSLDGEEVIRRGIVPYFSWPDGEHKRSGK